MLLCIYCQVLRAATADFPIQWWPHPWRVTANTAMFNFAKSSQDHSLGGFASCGGPGTNTGIMQYVYVFCLFLYIFLQLQNKIWLDPTRENKGVDGNAMYYHQIKISMIWSSHTDKVYIKMIGYPWEFDWNLHHQQFLFKKINHKNDMSTHAFCTCFCFCWRPSKISPTSENNTAVHCCYSSLFIFLGSYLVFV